MSKKDVEKYYDQITADYTEMINSLKEMEELAAQDIVNPDKIEELKTMIAPIKNNYLRISYIMFLLNQPARKEKQERYKNQNKKFLNNIKQEETEHQENKRILSTLNTVNNLLTKKINTEEE